MPLYQKAKVHQVTLQPSGDGATVSYKARGQTISLTTDLPNLNALVAGCMNALRAAEQRATQLPEFSLTKDITSGQLIPLPVDQWRVTTSEDLPGHVLVHILAAGGLYLTYSLGGDAILALTEAVSSAGLAEPSSKQKPNTPLN